MESNARTRLAALYRQRTSIHLKLFCICPKCPFALYRKHKTSTFYWKHRDFLKETTANFNRGRFYVTETLRHFTSIFYVKRMKLTLAENVRRRPFAANVGCLPFTANVGCLDRLIQPGQVLSSTLHHCKWAKAHLSHILSKAKLSVYPRRYEYVFFKAHSRPKRKLPITKSCQNTSITQDFLILKKTQT